MTATPVGRQHVAEFEQKIKDGIVQRTRVRIQSLAVEVAGDRIIISGWVPSYYLRQLVLQGALEAVGSASANRVEFNVQEATGPPKPPGQEAR
jgi:hypothetical protein